jgi:hypothetical protein
VLSLGTLKDNGKFVLEKVNEKLKPLFARLKTVTFINTKMTYQNFSMQQSSPMEHVQLRSEASVCINGIDYAVSYCRLRRYAKTVINGKEVDSLFSGEFYFGEPLPERIPEDLFMRYEGQVIKLLHCEESKWLEKCQEEESDLTFGIEFSYALASQG